MKEKCFSSHRYHHFFHLDELQVVIEGRKKVEVVSGDWREKYLYFLFIFFYPLFFFFLFPQITTCPLSKVVKVVIKMLRRGAMLWRKIFQKKMFVEIDDEPVNLIILFMTLNQGKNRHGMSLSCYALS